MKKPFDREEVCLRIGRLVALGRLAARLRSIPADASAALASIEGSLVDDLSPEHLADIPDVAMPDADIATHLSGSAPKPHLQLVRSLS